MTVEETLDSGFAQFAYKKDFSLNSTDSSTRDKGFEIKNIAVESTDNFNLKRAVFLFNKVIRQNGNNYLAYFGRALARFGLNDYKGGFSDFESCLAINSRFSEIYYRLGYYRAKVGDLKGAINAYTHLIRLNPEIIYGYFLRSEVYKNDKQYAAAAADLSKIIEATPLCSLAFFKRSLCNDLVGDSEKAIADFYTVSELTSIEDLVENADRIKGVNSFLSDNDYENMLAESSTRILDDPNNPYPYFERGYILSLLHEYNGAIRDYSSALKLKQDPLFVHLFRARAYYAAGEYEKAIDDYNEITETDFYIVYNERGQTHYKIKNYTEAIGDFEKALQLNPNYEFAHINLAKCYQVSGDHETAINVFDHAISLLPDTPVLYYYRGFVKQITGDFEGAENDESIFRYLSLKKKHPHTPTIHLRP